VAGRLSDFTAAANELGLSQAAASQRIRKLEATLGTHSFDWRDGDSIWDGIKKEN
jgi:LysR family glycine cleavage system transcriptional activator